MNPLSEKQKDQGIPGLMEKDDTTSLGFLNMRDPLTTLKEQAEKLGNHNQKYIHAISSRIGALTERLEGAGKIDRVHLWLPALNLKAEMDTVVAVGENLRQKLDFLGCYYSLQFLQMNLRTVNVLRFNLVATQDRFNVYKQFMKQSGNEFRQLTAAYMNKLLELFIPREERPEFCICGVGTRADQDDIDVGIIDDGSEKRKELNMAVGKMSGEMFRFASSFHFHLSEHVRGEGYSASIPEYRAILDKEIRDFVIIAEMLGAAHIIGSRGLLKRFKEKITERYFYHRRGDNRYHEGYLRGILGELISLLARPLSSQRIHPKDDGLRIIKGIISAKKTIFGVKEVNAWDIIEHLKQRDPKVSEYAELEDALTFLEIFRYLYQLFVVQEEDIFLDDESTRLNIQTIAKVLGYEDIGVISAGNHLLVDYYEWIQRTRRCVPALIDDLKRHLRSTSIFTPMFEEVEAELASEKYEANFAAELVKNLRFFHGTTFWDDVLEALERELLLTRFISDIESLSEHDSNTVIHRYFDWASYDLYSLMNLLVILYEEKTDLCTQRLFKRFNSVFLNRLSELPNITYRMALLFHLYPRPVNFYLGLLDSSSLSKFRELLNHQQVLTEEMSEVVEKLVSLCNLYQISSHHFKRFFQRITGKYPECLRDLGDVDKLRELSKGIFGHIKNLPSFEAKKEALGDYYDLEFFIVGLQTLEGESAKETNLQFTQFSDNYIQTLFDICKQEVDKVHRRRVATRDHLAIYAAGGHAREQAYDDDYDMIVLLDSSSGEVLKYCSQIIAKMNTEMIKRGVLPHYRFAEHFGKYVVTLDELERLFEDETPDSFIDKSQILCSRLVVGSSKFEDKFEERIIRRYIFDSKSEYIDQMFAEMASRHLIEDEELDGYDVKESPGGLRDIEMMLLVYKAKFNLRQPINSLIFETLSKLDTQHVQEIEKLCTAFHFLKRVRDVYRLTVAAVDKLSPDYLSDAAKILDFVDDKGAPHPHKLMDRCFEITAEVRDTIRRLMKNNVV